MAVQHHAIEMKLEGLPTPHGEITLNDLTAIAAPLQQLAMRIGRDLAGQTGPGRNLAAVDRSTELRLTGITEGSTCLEFGLGEVEALIDHDIERETADRLFEVWGACAGGERPEWVTPLIAESVNKLLDGLSRASSVSVGTGDHPIVTFAPRDSDRAPWNPIGETTDDRVTTMVGVLEAVDLANGAFRLLDSVGNRIPLRRVQDPHDAATLIDQQVAATGTKVHEAGHLRGLDSPTIARHHLPPEWTTAVSFELSAVIDSGVGPDPDGGDLTEDEFAALMAAIKG